MPVLNFAWGSHLNLDQFQQIIRGQPLSRERAILRDYRLTSSALLKFPSDQADLAGDGGGPRLMKSPGSIVYGVLYEISLEQWQVLDDYELAWGFEVVDLPVELESGRRLVAQVHNLVLHGDLAATSECFIQVMKSGLQELGYSAEVVALTESSLRNPT